MSSRSTTANRHAPTLVSVVLPVRDAASFLPQQLEALATQTYSGPWELVACDDGSTDTSRSLIEAAAAANAWPLTVVQGDGLGPGPARNMAVQAAAGEFLCFCDADDLVDSRWLEAHVAASTDFDMIAGRLDRSALNSSSAQRSRGRADDRAAILVSSCNFSMWADRFIEVGGFDPALRVAEDTDLSVRAVHLGFRIGFADDAVVAYRYRTDVRSLFQQQWRSAVFGRLLRRRYPDDREVFPLRSSPAQQLFWLAIRTPYLATGRRSLWIARLAGLLGDVWGRFKKLPPTPQPVERRD